MYITCIHTCVYIIKIHIYIYIHVYTPYLNLNQGIHKLRFTSKAKVTLRSSLGKPYISLAQNHLGVAKKQVGNNKPEGFLWLKKKIESLRGPTYYINVILKDLKWTARHGRIMNVSKTPQNLREKLDFDIPMTHLTLLWEKISTANHYPSESIRIICWPVLSLLGLQSGPIVRSQGWP